MRRPPFSWYLAAILGWAFCAPWVFAAEELVTAIKARDFSTAEHLLNEGVDPDSAETDGTTALHWAIYHDAAAIAIRLIEAGAPVMQANDYGSTPMSEAATLGNVEVLSALLNADADVDSANAENQTALMVIARTSNVPAAQLLLDWGASVDAREQWKDQTALMWATARKQPDMVALLLAHGADPNVRSRAHNWARMVTAEPRAKYLPTGGLTPLLFAAREGCLQCARHLVEAGAEIDTPDPESVTPLLTALLNAHFDTARYLAEQGANIDKWDWWGRTPLYAAVDYNTIPHGGRPDRPSLDETTALDMIEMLLTAGAYPDPQMKLLQPFRNVGADRGADPILGIGVTPLIRAAKSGDVAAMRLLLDHGALPDLPNANDLTPLMAATGLRSYAIDTRGRFKTEEEALAATRVLVEAGADLSFKDSSGQTALHGAAFRGWTRIVEYLAEQGADLAVEDNYGSTPLDAAMGRMRGRGGRAASVVNVFPETAARIETLLAEQ